MIEELELVDNELEIVDAPAALSPMLQSIARNYLGARMRAGDAILESARYLAEARNAAQHGEWYVFLAAVQTSQDAADRLLAIHAESERSPRFAEAMRTNFLTVSTAYELTTAPPAVQDRLLTQETPPTREQIRGEKRAANPAPARDLNQSAPDPLPSEDEQHAETIRAILKEAADKGERTGTRLYQQAYDHAREIHDVQLYNKMIALIDHETDTPPPPPAPDAPTLESLDASLPTVLQNAGYYWQSARPPIIAHNDGWRGDAPTVELALDMARLRMDGKGEPIAVFPALNPMECKALIREAKLFVEKGADRFFPTLGKAIRIAARIALEATE